MNKELKSQQLFTNIYGGLKDGSLRDTENLISALIQTDLHLYPTRTPLVVKKDESITYSMTYLLTNIVVTVMIEPVSKQPVKYLIVQTDFKGKIIREEEVIV